MITAKKRNTGYLKIIVLYILLAGPTPLFCQNPPITQQDVYKNDLSNRLKVLKGFNAGGDAKNFSNAAARSAAPAVTMDQLSTDINNNSNLDDKKYNLLIQQTRLAYLDIIRKKVNVPANKLHIETLNPWQDFKTDLLDVSTGGTDKASVKNIINGTQYVSFWVCNMDNAPQSVQLRTAQPSSTSSISFYDARFILSRLYKDVPDALVPINGDVTIAPGEVKVFFAQLKGLKSGTENNNIQVSSKLGNTSIPLSIQNYAVTVKPGSTDLNTINWAYYVYPMLQGKEKEATVNLRDHYINTIVVLNSVLPDFQNPASTPAFEGYMDKCSAYDNIMLLLDLRRQSKNKDYLTPAWKTSFTNWYTFIMNSFKKNGLDKKKVYLYVVDEPKPEELPFLTDFIKWARSGLPGVKLYSTLNEDRCTSTLLPLLDVGQLYNRSLLNLTIKNDDMKKIWIYDTKSKSLAPYQSFRLMAWEAFFKGYGGIGFWNYADIAKVGNNNQINAWNDFDGKYADYNVVYDLDGKIINSRRWEAFKLGVEDYYILSLYAKKYGMAAARQYCSQVLTNAKDISQADAVRNLCLSKL